ncbi:hypothetical protein BABINDRAFT_162080 [Babjeviella inositovora NRRL Y-12698]|uniref:ATP-dependent helicase IRC3 n=1 Tax=Babjeviella inositovora NRRL Y-12698 TaxID=984486 RepID=A0A1E3QMQ9_9ASCO|nr:uncharacterized protein BABINDRAFT_162080 [Babjeviella inositovora NRRL Y-12698]ODQ79006.1 hypothetical protein BABINDRAFT_162080 [Babjeviella inositovora NRRL Y-12698]
MGHVRFLTHTSYRTKHVEETSHGLRDYQEECISHSMAAMAAGRTKLAVSLPTGSGKTVIFVNLIKRTRQHPPKKALILVHRKELAAQAMKACAVYLPDLSVGLEMAENRALPDNNIVIASVASLSRGNRLDLYVPSEFDLIIIDECHHAVAPSYRKILQHFKSASVPYIGFSATLERADLKTLHAVFPEVVYQKSLSDFALDRWLSDIVFTTVETEADLSVVEVYSQTGDYNTNKLSTVMNTSHNNSLILTTYIHMAKTYSRMSTLVFCINIDHLRSLQEVFIMRGVDARFVTGETKSAERIEIVEAFKRGEFPVLLNCGVFTEGTDIPNIDCVLLARPTRSRPLLTQMIGRGLRRAMGKDNCHIIDFVGLNDTDAQTVPALLGLKSSTKLKGMSLSEILALQKEQQAKNLTNFPERFLEELRMMEGPTEPVFSDDNRPMEEIKLMDTETALEKVNYLSLDRELAEEEMFSKTETDEVGSTDAKKREVEEVKSPAKKREAIKTASADQINLQTLFYDYLDIGRELDKEAEKYPDILSLQLDFELSSYPWLALNALTFIVPLLHNNNSVLDRRVFFLCVRKTKTGYTMTLDCTAPGHRFLKDITSKVSLGEVFSLAENYLNLISGNHSDWRKHALWRYDSVLPSQHEYITREFGRLMDGKKIAVEGYNEVEVSKFFSALTFGDFASLVGAFRAAPRAAVAYILAQLGWGYTALPRSGEGSNEAFVSYKIEQRNKTYNYLYTEAQLLVQRFKQSPVRSGSVYPWYVVDQVSVMPFIHDTEMQARFYFLVINQTSTLNPTFVVSLQRGYANAITDKTDLLTVQSLSEALGFGDALIGTVSVHLSGKKASAWRKDAKWRTNAITDKQKSGMVGRIVAILRELDLKAGYYEEKRLREFTLSLALGPYIDIMSALTVDPALMVKWLMVDRLRVWPKLVKARYPNGDSNRPNKRKNEK